MHYIYGLVDPRDGAVKYIGRTGDLDARRRSHGYDKVMSGQKYRDWLLSLLAIGVKPDLIVLQECKLEEAPDLEARWIERFGGTSRLTNAVARVSLIRRPVKYGVVWQ